MASGLGGGTYVGVAGGRGAGEGVVHVDCPLETFAGLGVSYSYIYPLSGMAEEDEVSTHAS